jgi:hypothetical protein
VLVALVIGPADWIDVAAMLKSRVERAASESKDGSGVGVDLAPASYGAEVRR